MPPRQLPDSDPAQLDPDYAVGRLASEIAQLCRRDERLSNRIEILSDRLDTFETETIQAKGAFKMASWILGLVLTGLLSLGVWLVRTTIVDEQRIEVLERDTKRLQDLVENTNTTLNEMGAQLREIRVTQAQEVTQQQESREDVKHRLERLETRRR